MQAVKTKEKASLISGVLGGTISLTVSTLVVKLLGLIYKIPLASVLGDLGMGYFNSAYTVYSLFYLLCTAGVPKAVMMLISEAKAEGRRGDERNIVRVASLMFVSLGIFLTVVFTVFSAPIARFIGSSKSAFTMVAIAPSIVFVSLAGVIRGYLSAGMYFLDIAISQVIEGVGKLALGLLFAMVGKRLNMPLEMLSAMTILGVTLGALFGLLYLLICSKIRKEKENTGQNDIKIQNKQIAKRILSISIPITLSAAIMSMTSIIDLVLIMSSLTKIGYSESQANALYGNYTTLAVPMFNLALSIITPISVAHMPTLTSSFASKNTDLFRSCEKSAYNLTGIASAPMMLGLGAFSQEILSVLFPKSETFLGGDLLTVLSPSILFSSLLIIVNTSLEAMGRVKAPLVSMLFGSAAKFLVSYLIITKTEMGVFGAPIGTVISYATALFVSLIIYSRATGKSIPVIDSFGIPYIMAAVAVLTARFTYNNLEKVINRLPLLLICILLAALIYLVLITTFGILSPKKAKQNGKMYKKCSAKLENKPKCEAGKRKKSCLYLTIIENT